MMYSIWVTSACNLRCKYCYEGNEKPSYIMDESIAESVLDYMKKDLKNKDDKELYISFHGGEPFLNYKIMKYFVKRIKEEFKDYKKMFLTTTNTTILNEEIIDFIINDLDDISISIDGMKKTHDCNRPFKNGEGSYDTVYKNAMKLKGRLDKEIRVRTTYDSQTVYTLSDDVKHLLDLGFKVIVPGHNIFDKNWDEKDILELEKQIAAIKEYIKDYEDVFVSLCDPIDFNKGSRCTGGIDNIHIYPDGTLYPCMMAGGIEEFNIGNIYDGLDLNKLQSILSYSNYTNEECRECALCNVCDSSRCKIINKLITGSYIEPEPVGCAVNNVLYKINGICR